MAESRRQRHGLESFLDITDSSDVGALEVTIEACRGYVNLRGQADDAAFVQQAEAVLGQKLPVAANTTTQGNCRVFWLGPDEWLISATPDDAATICANLATTLQDLHVAVNDQSGGLLGLTLRGSSAEHVLAKGCTLDLHATQFQAGHCAQSSLAKANVLIARHNDEQFELIVRRSFANYLLSWLERAAREFGTRFSTT